MIWYSVDANTKLQAQEKEINENTMLNCNSQTRKLKTSKKTRNSSTTLTVILRLHSYCFVN